MDLINCWEPATKEVNNKLGPNSVVYAFTVEGYYKWGHGAYVHTKALQRGNLSAIYKVLNYYLGGEYRAYQAQAARLCRAKHGSGRAIRDRPWLAKR